MTASQVLPALKSLEHAALSLDPRTFDRALSCVHCGLCLPACPTYTTTHHEADSPRGRIQLMRALAEGTIQATDSVRLHLDLCLDCRACETACPSGVVYHELIEETRARMEGDLRSPATAKAKPAGGGLLRWLLFHVMTRPTRLKLALLPVRVMQKTGVYRVLEKIGAFRLFPRALQGMLRMLPAGGAMWPRKLPERLGALDAEKRGRDARATLEDHGRDARATDARGALRGRAPRVAFFGGCVGSVIYDRVNRQAVELLAAAGCEVIVPRAQECCGAIHHHNGAWGPAMDLAKRNIEALLACEPDFVTTTIAGCGAMLHEYDHLLRDDPAWAGRAEGFVSKVRDIAEVLAEVGLPELKHPIAETVAYHDACHLAHAQKVTDAPRKLLAKIPGIRIVPLAESDMCCGAAGTYNLTQPEMAGQLGRRKVEHLRQSRATMCAAGNVGCAMHIQSQARAAGIELRVVHPVELLHLAAFGTDRS